MVEDDRIEYRELDRLLHFTFRSLAATKGCRLVCRCFGGFAKPAERRTIGGGDPVPVLL